MVKKIVGKQDVDYTSRKTGEPVKGVTLHCVGQSSRVNGMSADQHFISVKTPELYEEALSFPVGVEINLNFNQYGTVESVSLCQNQPK